MDDHLGVRYAFLRRCKPICFSAYFDDLPGGWVGQFADVLQGDVRMEKITAAAQPAIYGEYSTKPAVRMSTLEVLVGAPGRTTWASHRAPAFWTTGSGITMFSARQLDHASPHRHIILQGGIGVDDGEKRRFGHKGLGVDTARDPRHLNHISGRSACGAGPVNSRTAGSRSV